MRQFEWDLQKAEQNLLKHGISFDTAASALLGLGVTQPSVRAAENRFMTFCEIEGRLVTVIWTPRLNVIRIVSARAARKNEQAYYRQSVGRSAAARRH